MTPRLPKGEAAFNALFRKLERRAEKRGYEWALTKEEVRKLTSQPCCYCGAEPQQASRGQGYNGEYLYNGLDRVKNKLGYTLKNVVPCCRFCNQAKFTRTLSEFATWVRQIHGRLPAWESSKGKKNESSSDRNRSNESPGPRQSLGKTQSQVSTKHLPHL